MLDVVLKPFQNKSHCCLNWRCFLNLCKQVCETVTLRSMPKLPSLDCAWRGLPRQQAVISWMGASVDGV